MISAEYRRLPTSEAVWVAIQARHGSELRVFSSYSFPEGNRFGDPAKAVMETEYAFPGARWPLLGASTTWDVADTTNPRQSERTEYWLYVRPY